MRVEFSKGKFIDENGNELANSTETPDGTLIQFKVIKNKTCPPDRRVGFYTLKWNGVDVLADLIEVAIRVGVIEKSGAWFTVPEVKDKIQGQNGVRKFLEEHQDILTVVNEQIDDKIQ